jgi:hypothetical protein
MSLSVPVDIPLSVSLSVSASPSVPVAIPACVPVPASVALDIPASVSVPVPYASSYPCLSLSSSPCPCGYPCLCLCSCSCVFASVSVSGLTPPVTVSTICILLYHAICPWRCLEKHYTLSMILPPYRHAPSPVTILSRLFPRQPSMKYLSKSLFLPLSFRPVSCSFPCLCP